MFASNSLVELALSFQKSRILLTACELRVFTVLGKGKKLSMEVARAIGASERATDRLLNALCAMGLLKKRGILFSNTPTSSKFLGEDSPNFIRGLMHYVNMWDTWTDLTQAVRYGKSVSGRAISERGEKWLDAFIAAMHERAYKSASEVIKLLDLKKVSKVLDVGGGSGVYSMAFVRARKAITAAVFDLPNVVPLTKKYIKTEGLSDKINTVAGDYNVDEFGSGFDLVFLSAIIHINSPDKNQALILKASQGLNPGGQVVIQDFIMNEDRVRPDYGAIFALNMLVATEEGDTYTESEVRDWMRKAGLVNIIRKDTKFATTLIIGRKEG